MKQFSIISQETDPTRKIGIFYLEGPTGGAGLSWIPASAPLSRLQNQNQLAGDILKEIGVVPLGFFVGPRGYSFIVDDSEGSMWGKFHEATQKRWGGSK